MRISLLLSVGILAVAATLRAEPVHVLVWDERQPRQSQAYDSFLGNEIVARLKASTDDLKLRSVALDDQEQLGNDRDGININQRVPNFVRQQLK